MAVIKNQTDVNIVLRVEEQHVDFSDPSWLAVVWSPQLKADSWKAVLHQGSHTPQPDYLLAWWDFLRYPLSVRLLVYLFALRKPSHVCDHFSFAVY